MIFFFIIFFQISDKLKEGLKDHGASYYEVRESHQGIFGPILWSQNKFFRTKMRLKVRREIESQIVCRLFTANLLQVYCRLFKDICRLFAVRKPYLDFSSDSMPYTHSSGLQKKTRYEPSDRPMDGWTDRPSCRDASTHLKICQGKSF